MSRLKDKVKEQVFYNNRFVDKDTFRAFVYNKTEQKLAKSYDEFEQLIATGLWFITKEEYEKNEQKLQLVKNTSLADIVKESLSDESKMSQKILRKKSDGSDG
jgi:hypothetical protein